MIASARGSAVKLAAVYWALLVFGMALYSALRLDALAELAPVWVGAVGGTILGQVLAARRYRIWLAILIMISTAIFVLPQLPEELSRTKLWMAFLPAALSGYWSLGDRTSLAAFWFPSVIWMLSILDGTDAAAMPDHTGLVLLAALAALFVVYLRVREERRVALWRTIAPTPLAVVRPQLILKERTAPQLARAAWAVLVATLGFAGTAWLAPRLWEKETFAHERVRVATHAAPGHYGVHGLPCCPVATDADATRSRVKEYFDLGRGHDVVGKPHRAGIDCESCGHTTDVAVGDVGIGVETHEVGSGGGGGGYGYSDTDLGPVQYNVAGEMTPQSGWQTIHRDVGVEVRPDPWADSALDPRFPAPSTPSYVGPTVNPYAQQIIPPAPPVPPPPPTPPTSYASQLGVPPVAPAAAVQTLPPAAEPAVAEHGPLVEPDVEAEPPPARTPSHAGAVALDLAALLVLALVMTKLASIALRPLRRLLTLRHLRQPFWPETVDQRVSNAWQLALIGLRDAGYRASMSEPPAALARRVDVEGVERCATILERARHGIGIDREDLADMTTTADGAYRAARARTGRVRRAMSWLRWPLA